MPDLSVKNLHVFRGERHLLQGLAFGVPRGRCLQVTGENGAGKTTLLRVLAGLLEAESLELCWSGRAAKPRDADYLGALAYLGHDTPLKADLTGAENVRFAVGIRRRVTGEGLQAAFARVGASRFADRPVRTLSAGQRRRIALAGLYLAGASLWLLDEPTTNLDAAGQQLMRSLIEEQLAGGGLVIAATHQDLGLDARQQVSLQLGGTA
jgi:heme exporter protein A